MMRETDAMRFWIKMGGISSLSLVLGLLAVCSAVSQGRQGSAPSPEQMVEEHVTRMAEELGLADEQVAQVRPIIEEHVAKVRTLMDKRRQQGRRPGGSGREELEALRKEMEERLETVLTEEQMRTYREKQEERRERMRERRGQLGGRPPW